MQVISFSGKNALAKQAANAANQLGKKAGQTFHSASVHHPPAHPPVFQPIKGRPTLTKDTVQLSPKK